MCRFFFTSQKSKLILHEMEHRGYSRTDFSLLCIMESGRVHKGMVHILAVAESANQEHGVILSISLTRWVVQKIESDYTPPLFRLTGPPLVELVSTQATWDGVDKLGRILIQYSHWGTLNTRFMKPEMSCNVIWLQINKPFAFAVEQLFNYKCNYIHWFLP